MPAKDIEERVRKIISKDPEKGEEQFAINQAQNEVYGINAELMNNLEQEKNSSALLQKNNEALAQAAEIGVSGGGGLNPSTQEVLKKYGYQGRPEIKMNRPTGNPPTQGRPVIVNNNYNTTNNVVAGGDQGNSNKFKAWLSNVFNRQKNEYEVQQKEYRKREWSLTRSANKMMRKMERISKSFSEQVNPQNMGKTIGNQLKVALLAMGGIFLAKNWTKVMDTVASIESGVRAFFGDDSLNTTARNTKGGIFVNRIKEYLGFDTEPGSDGYNKSVPGMIGTVLKQEIGILIETFKEWMEKRGMAVKAVKFPDLGLGGGSGWISELMQPLGTAMKGMSTYIGDLLSALITGEYSITRPLAREVSSAGKNEAQRKGMRNKIIDSDADRNFTIGSDYDSDGLIKNQPSSMHHATSQGAVNISDTKSNVVHAASTLNTLSSIEKNIKESPDGILINREFLANLGVSSNTLSRFEEEGKIKKIPLKIVEAPLENADIEGDMEGSALEDAGRGALRWGIGGVLVGGFGLGGAATKYTATYGMYRGLKGRAEDRQELLDGTKKILVPESDPRPAISKNRFPADYLTKEGWEEIKKELQSPEFSNDSVEALKWIKDYLVKKKENKDNLVFDFNPKILEEVEAKQARFEELEAKYDQIKREKYPNAYKLNEHLTRDWNRAVSAIGDVTKEVIAKFRNGKNISDSEQHRRVNYIMKRLINETGLSPEQAAGLVGNLVYEAGGWLNENADYADHIGIAQWGPTRQKKYEEWKGNGKKLKGSSFEDQVDFLMHEVTSGDYKNAIKKLKEANNAQDASDLALGYYEFSAGFEGAKKALMNNGEHSLTEAGFNDSVMNRRRFSNAVLSVYQNTKAAKEEFEKIPGNFDFQLGENGELSFTDDSTFPDKIEIAKQLYSMDPSLGTKVGEMTYVGGIPLLNSKEEITNYAKETYPIEKKKELYKKWFGNLVYENTDTGRKRNGEKNDPTLNIRSQQGDPIRSHPLTIDLGKPISTNLREILEQEITDPLKYEWLADTRVSYMKSMKGSVPYKNFKYKDSKSGSTVGDAMDILLSRTPFIPKYEAGWSVTGEEPKLNPLWVANNLEGRGFKEEDLIPEVRALSSLPALIQLQIQQADQTNLILTQLVNKPPTIQQSVNVQGSKTATPTSNSNGG